MKYKMDVLNLKLKLATKHKLNIERQVYKLRNTERSTCEELYSMKAEIKNLTEQLEHLKDKISDTGYEVSRIDVSRYAEKAKLESRLCDLRAHKRGFDDISEREHDISELRNKELKEKEAEEQELERQKQMEIDEKNEQQIKETAAIEEECAAIEKECVVLKKRNNAIMLKLRRKLVETEDARRKAMKRCGVTSDN